MDWSGFIRQLKILPPFKNILTVTPSCEQQHTTGYFTATKWHRLTYNLLNTLHDLSILM
jgi:hypothetical protein